MQVCRAAAGEYNLSLAGADAVIDHPVSTIENQWKDAADAARLTDLERESFKGRQILNPFIHYT